MALTYLEILTKQLPIDEGYRRKPYPDTKGKLTIGVGRNLDDVGLRDDEIALCLSNDIAVAEAVARKLFPTFDQLSDARKAVVLNMAFNMGEETLKEFVHTIGFITAGKYDAAAAGMLDSLWAKQVGVRAVRLAEAMKTG